MMRRFSSSCLAVRIGHPLDTLLAQHIRGAWGSITVKQATSRILRLK